MTSYKLEADISVYSRDPIIKSISLLLIVIRWEVQNPLTEKWSVKGSVVTENYLKLTEKKDKISRWWEYMLADWVML